MYKRFLNNEDYLSLITKDGLSQLIRGDEFRLIQAEQSAEISILEYLSDNFEIEEVLNDGKNIEKYNRQITYTVGNHFLFNEKTYRVIRSISGFKFPSNTIYWSENMTGDDPSVIRPYSQFESYQTKDMVTFNGVVWDCMSPNGYDFNDIHIPGINGWQSIEAYNWQPKKYNQWEVVTYGEYFYTLTDNGVGYDETVSPLSSNNWGRIGEYDSNINTYELSDHEYVVKDNKVFFPLINVNSDVPEDSKNICIDDIRNLNIKKHMLQLSMYELHKLISPNNVSAVRITDYNNSIQWLRDASRLKLNPHIPRKLDKDDGKPITDWQLATFQRDYDPNQNPWQI